MIVARELGIFEMDLSLLCIEWCRHRTALQNSIFCGNWAFSGVTGKLIWLT